LGKGSIHLFTINTIAPILFLYGREKDRSSFYDLALKLLEEVPPESNHLISKWREIGLSPASAYQSQALLELKKEYCQAKDCLNCAIGAAILKN